MSDDSAANATTGQSAADQVAGMVSDGGGQETTNAVGDRPEHVPEKFWDAEKGSVRIDDALKSYSELEKRFGSFTGAPEEYAIGISEELKEKGVDIQNDHPLMESAKAFAKDLQMNQEGFSKMINLLAKYELGQAQANQQAIADDMKALGDTADRRLNNLSQWAARNLPGDLQEGFKDLAVSADAVKALEQIVSMTRGAPMQPDNAVATPGVTKEELQKMQFEKDEFGRRRIQSDPEFRDKFRKLQSEFYGDEPHRQIVGK